MSIPDSTISRSSVSKVLIDGWRGVHHSFAMVNQHQIIALMKRGDVELFHNDMPFLMPHWNTKDHTAGFSETDLNLIMSLASIDEAEVECVYRICAPMFAPTRRALKTVTFGITELGFDSGSFHNPNQDLNEMICDRNIVVTSSRWSRDRLLDYGFPEDKVRVVSCGVDLQTFFPLGKEAIQTQRKTLNIPDEMVVFLNVGVSTWNKGIDLLLRAYAKVHKSNKNTRLILKDSKALYGISVENVMRDVERDHPGLLTAEVLSSISVINTNLSQSQLQSLYSLADWYVSPYRAEGFNLPVLEAQACGTPVIASSGGATDDFCSTIGVRKIPSIFNRGVLRGTNESCWVEPDIASLETLMTQAAKEGPTGINENLIRKSAKLNAEKYTWDNSAVKLKIIMDN